MSEGTTAVPIRLGGYQPERSVHTRAMRVIEERLRRELGGAVDVRFVPDIVATGRPAGDLLALTEAGDIDVCYFASSYLAARVPALGVLDLPFPEADRARLWSKLDGAAGAALRGHVEAVTGYTVLGFWDNGIRHISNRVRAIRTPADCVGLSIRTLDNRFHQAMFAALGFQPRFIDVKDLANAVRSRAVDAQENPLTNIVNFGIQETHGHVSLLGQFSGIALLLANRSTVEVWPAHVRDAVITAVAEGTVLQREMAAQEDAACLEVLEAAGVEIVKPGEIDLAAFRRAVAPVVAHETAALDPALLALWSS